MRWRVARWFVVAFHAAVLACATAPALVDPAHARVFNAAFERYNAGSYPEARATIQALEAAPLTPYERSRVEQLLLAIDLQEQRYPSARQHVERALASGGLTADEADWLRFMGVQLFIAEERWRAAIEAWHDWLAHSPKPPEGYRCSSIAMAYVELGDLESARRVREACTP
jgi:predicted Zn-dependent protease